MTTEIEQLLSEMLCNAERTAKDYGLSKEMAINLVAHGYNNADDPEFWIKKGDENVGKTDTH